MSRTPLLRTCHLALAALFLLASGEKAFGLGACPHHDRLGGAAGQEPAGGGHPAPGAPAHGGHGSDPSGDGGEGHGPCTCLGACHVDSAAPLSLSPAGAAPAGAGDLSERPLAPTSERRRAPTPYSLPWSTAPPALR